MNPTPKTRAEYLRLMEEWVEITVREFPTMPTEQMAGTASNIAAFYQTLALFAPDTTPAAAGLPAEFKAAMRGGLLTIRSAYALQECVERAETLLTLLDAMPEQDATSDYQRDCVRDYETLRDAIMLHLSEFCKDGDESEISILEKTVEKVSVALAEERAKSKTLTDAIHAIAYEPFGDAEASHTQVLDDITAFAIKTLTSVEGAGK